jgi:hypothetical protein
MPPSQASAEESQDSTMLLIAIIAGVVCCLLIIGVIAVLVLKNKKRDDDNGDPYTVAITRNDIDDGTYSSHVVCCVSTPHTHSHNYLSGGSLKSATDYPGTTFNSSASEPYGHLPSSVASSDYDAGGLALAGGALQADDNYGIMPSLGAGECTIFRYLCPFVVHVSHTFFIVKDDNIAVGTNVVSEYVNIGGGGDADACNKKFCSANL